MKSEFGHIVGVGCGAAIETRACCERDGGVCEREKGMVECAVAVRGY